MSNYLDAADTDDEDDKCTSVASPEDIAVAQERCFALKGDSVHFEMPLFNHRKNHEYPIGTDRLKTL